MIYKQAMQLKVGDTVYMQKVDKPIVIAGIEVDESAKAVFVRGKDGVTYYHSILTLDRPVKDVKKTENNKSDEILIYYQIQSYNKANDIDEVCQSHIYPSYVTCFGVKDGMRKPINIAKLNGASLMIQSNPHDGLKFVKRESAEKMIEAAKKVWPEKEFELVPFDYRFYGRMTPRWVVVD